MLVLAHCAMMYKSPICCSFAARKSNSLDTFTRRSHRIWVRELASFFQMPNNSFPISFETFLLAALSFHIIDFTTMLNASRKKIKKCVNFGHVLFRLLKKRKLNGLRQIFNCSFGFERGVSQLLANVQRDYRDDAAQSF